MPRDPAAGAAGDLLTKVRAELSRYQHPLLLFDAEERPGGGLVLTIDLRNRPEGVHTYEATLHPRDIDSGQFSWTLQRYLYDCLHDYTVELFLRTPQDHDADR